MARTTIKTTTFVTIPGTDKEVALIHTTEQHESDMLFEAQRDGRTLIGYLVHDDDAGNPLEDQEGNGRVFSSSRQHAKESHHGFQEALGLDSSFHPNLELLRDDDVVKAAHAKFAEDATLLNAVFQWCRQYYDDEGGSELEYVCRNLKTINDIMPSPLDVYALQMSLWREGRKNGTVGNKYAVVLDVFEHGQIMYSISGTGPQCAFDTARGGAVWVPDDCAVDNFEDKSLSLEENRAKAREYAKSCVEEYTNWCNGDCWGAVVQYDDGEQVDEVMWGLVGHDAALKELKELFEHGVEHDPKPVPVEAPALDIDKVLFRDREMLPHCRRERRIVANLIASLDQEGFKLVRVFDTEDFTGVSDMKSAMELIFNLDEAYLFVQKDGFNEHYIRLTLGEDLDVICDYSFSNPDADGFNAVMDNFKAEDFA